MVELLTKREMAARLHVSPATVLLWGRRGRIPVVRINQRTLRYDAEAVVRALKHEARPTTDELEKVVKERGGRR